MKINKIICSILSLLMISVIPMETFAQSITIEPAEESQYIIMVKDDASLETLLESYDAVTVDNADNICIADLTESQANRLDKKNYILNIEEDILLTASSNSEAEQGTEINQWYLDAIGVNDAEEVAKNVKIELLDSGVDFSDEFDAPANINLNEEDLNESPVFVDTTGHGTAIASIISSYNDNNGMEGINPNAQLYSVKVLDSNNQAPLSRIVNGIYWGIENDMDIINMSFGTDVNSPILYNAVKAAYDAGILMIAAAGNTTHQSVQYPAAYDEVLAVGSVNPSGELAEQTSAGTQLDVLAPGEQIAALDFLDSVNAVSGTSIATAQVTGIASLLWAKDKTKSNDFIKQLICSAVNKPDSLTGTNAGIIDYQNALNSYDEFDKVYIPAEKTDAGFEVNNKFDYSDAAVEALWQNTTNGHDGLATSATDYAGFSGNAPKIARYACTHLDQVNKNLPSGYKAYCPHGTGNYVISLKFLFRFSRYIYDYGNKVLDFNKIDNYINTYINNDDYWKSYGKEKDRARMKELGEQVKYFLKNKNIMETTIKNNFNNYSTETQNRYLGIMIFGMALHLAGDIYAHKTIVPTYTVKGTNPKSIKEDSGSGFNAMIGSADFNTASTFEDDTVHHNLIKLLCLYNYSMSNINESAPGLKNILYWQYLQRGISLQVVEFRDINIFLKSGATNVYEDNASFCGERYKAAMLSCKRIAARFKENGSFYTKLIYPKVYDGNPNTAYKTVKLNNFLGYTKAAQLDYIGVNLDENDWKVNSTSTLV